MFMYHSWLELPISTRIKIASQFGIIKKGSTEVFNNTVTSDGYLIKDIELALSKEKLQEFLQITEPDTSILWTKMLAKIDNKEVAIIKKRGRPSKK